MEYSAIEHSLYTMMFIGFSIFGICMCVSDLQKGNILPSTMNGILAAFCIFASLVRLMH